MQQITAACGNHAITDAVFLSELQLDENANANHGWMQQTPAAGANHASIAAVFSIVRKLAISVLKQRRHVDMEPCIETPS